MVSVFECSCHMPAYVVEIRRCFKEAYAGVHLQTKAKEAYAEVHLQTKAKEQKWYYDRTTSTVQLVLGDVVLMKSDTYQGK